MVWQTILLSQGKFPYLLGWQKCVRPPHPRKKAMCCVRRKTLNFTSLDQFLFEKPCGTFFCLRHFTIWGKKKREPKTQESIGIFWIYFMPAGFFLPQHIIPLETKERPWTQDLIDGLIMSQVPFMYLGRGKTTEIGKHIYYCESASNI